MKKQISYKIVSLVFSILVVCFAIAFYAVAWEDPLESPPGGDIPTPLNTGSVGQNKEGNLTIGGAGGAGMFETMHSTFLATVDGNVGIGTTNPSVGEEALKLDVEGAIGATKYCDQDGNNCKTITEMVGGGGFAFGDWVSMGNSQVVNGPATTDGFVLAVGITTASGPMYIRTDSNANPSIIRCKQTGYHSIDANKATSCFAPVKKGDYWKVTHNSTVAVYWLPVVSGGGGGVTTYDSGWFAISNGQNTILNHNLGSTALITDVFAADNSSGSNMQKVHIVDWTEDHFKTTGYSIQEIASNSFKFITGAHGLRSMDNSGLSTVTNRNWTWARVIAISP